MSEKKKVTALGEFVAGKAVFLAKGTVELKVGEKVISLPIKSAGIKETQEQLIRSFPHPPTSTIKVTKGSSYEIQHGMKVDDFVIVHDMADTQYMEEFMEHNTMFTWQNVIAGLDVTWKDTEGKEVTSFEAKKVILEDNGITGPHLDKIVKAIGQLVSDREDYADFLSSGKWG